MGQKNQKNSYPLFDEIFQKDKYKKLSPLNQIKYFQIKITQKN